MSVSLIVLLAGLVSASAVYLVSVSRSVADPIDPQGEINWFLRRVARHPRAAAFVRRRLDRSSISGFALTAAFATVFVGAFVVGSLFDMVTGNAGFARLDKFVANWGATNVSSGAVRVLRLVTALGSTTVVLIAAVLVSVWKFARTRRPGPAVFLMVVALGQLALNNLLKAAVGRARPDVARFVHVSGSSFPSGHSTAAAAVWAAVALALSNGRPRRVRAAFGALAALVAVAVGATRALLGAHWLTDVLAGLALGWSWFTLVAVTFGGRLLRAAAPVELAVGVPLPVAPGAVDDRATPVLSAPGTGSRRRLRSAGARRALLVLVASYATFVALGSAVGWFIVHIVDHSRIGRADVDANRWFVQHRTAGLDRLTGWLSNAGSTTVVVGLAVVAVVVLLVTTRSWRPATTLASGLVLEVSAFVTMANVVGRSRPDVVRLDPSPPTSSFPSGHTAASVALYLGLALVLGGLVRSARVRAALIVVSGTVVAAVAVARVYRGMHHVSDVVAGCVLGLASVAASRHWSTPASPARALREVGFAGDHPEGDPATLP